MARVTYSLSFYCRKAKTNKKGLAPLELSIIINQKRLFLNLPNKFSPLEFSKKRKPAHIQSVIDAYRVQADRVMVELMQNSIPITAATLREYLKNGGVRSMEVQDLFAQYLSSLKPRIGISMKKEVYRKYEISMNLCYELLGKNKEVCTINNGDMVLLYDTLKARYKHSTAAGYFTKIKTVFMYAVDNGYMRTNPFGGIRIDKGHPSTEYLTEAELDYLWNLELDGRLERARDLLLFQAYGGGMAYCDMATFDPKKMVKNGSVYLYSAKRKKTGIPFTTALLPRAIQILEKYDYILPIISNQRLNSYAKEIQGAAQMKKTLHTHLMRKSYATLLLSHQVPISTISKAMGHSNTAITSKIYAHVLDDTIASEIGNAFQ